MNRRILFCSNYYPPNFIGGAELTAHQYASTLRQKGHSVGVFCGDLHVKGPRHAVSREDYDGISVWRIKLQSEDFGQEESSFVDPITEDRFERVLCEFNPDVVHFHNIIGLSAGLISVAAAHLIPTVLSVHDHWGFCFKNTLLDPAGQVCRTPWRCSDCTRHVSGESGSPIPMRLRRDFVLEQVSRVDRIISPSRYLAMQYSRSGVPLDKFRIIPYGVDLARFRNGRRRVASEKLRIGFIGYIGEHKGVAVLLRAVELAVRRAQLDVQIAGDGHLRSVLEDHVRRRGLEGVVRFIGKVDHESIVELHQELDVLVVPSVWPENSPVTIYEAFAAETVVVASRVGGIPELVKHDETGLLFRLGAAEELADILDLLATDSEKLRTLSSGALSEIQEVSLLRQVSRAEKIYPKRPTGPNRSCSRKVVVLIGDGLSPDAAQAVEMADRDPDLMSIRFLRAKWLNEAAAATADVLWIVNPTSTIPDQLDSSTGVPVLAPEGWRGDSTAQIISYADSVAALRLLRRELLEQ